MTFRLSFLMEENDYSFARVMGFSIMLFYMYNATIIMKATKVFIDMPWGLISLVILGYGINRFTENGAPNFKALNKPPDV